MRQGRVAVLGPEPLEDCEASGDVWRSPKKRGATHGIWHSGQVYHLTQVLDSRDLVI